LINLSLYQAIELFNLQHGLYNPLRGFMNEDEVEGVLDLDFPLPILLTLNEKEFHRIKEGESLDLYFYGKRVGQMNVESKFRLDIKDYALKIYKEKDHPGYNLFLMNHTPYVIGGKVNQLNKIDFRDEFRKRGWKTVAGFQTRNIPHIAHEKVQRHALEITDGLLLSPVLGIKNKGDFKNEVIEKVYTSFYKTHYSENEAHLTFIFLNMRYLGPREAAFHAIVRKNLGCTHFIVGRDHAGVKGFYKPYEAQEFVQSLDLGIKIIPAPEVLYCPVCERPVFHDECRHTKEKISGTYVRQSIVNKKPDLRFFRETVAKELLKFDDPFVDERRDENYLVKRLIEEW